MTTKLFWKYLLNWYVQGCTKTMSVWLACNYLTSSFNWFLLSASSQSVTVTYPSGEMRFPLESWCLNQSQPSSLTWNFPQIPFRFLFLAVKRFNIRWALSYVGNFSQKWPHAVEVCLFGLTTFALEPYHYRKTFTFASAVASNNIEN